MPRYYFDVYSDGSIRTDDVGVELADPSEAREQAIAILPDLIRDKAPADGDYMVECRVKTANGSVIYSGQLSFSQVRIGRACSVEV